MVGLAAGYGVRTRGCAEEAGEETREGEEGAVIRGRDYPAFETNCLGAVDAEEDVGVIMNDERSHHSSWIYPFAQSAFG